MLYSVITTIQRPTDSVRKLAARLTDGNGHLVIAGDTKGPDSFDLSDVNGFDDDQLTFLGIDEQLATQFELAKLLPTKHYARKNIGYLQAVHAGASCIYETERIGIRPVGDPEFGAVQNETVIALFGPQLHADNVGARARLGHRQCADMFAADQTGQIFRLLLGRRVALDLVDAQIGMGAIAERDGGTGPGDFLDRHNMGQIAHARSAIFLRDRDAKEAEFAHLFPKIGGKFVGLIDVPGDGLDPLLCPAVHHVAQRADILAQIEIHRCIEHLRQSPRSKVTVSVSLSFGHTSSILRRAQHGSKG